MKHHPTPPQEIEFDMTPMIDVVFQLIVFFMLVMDMSTTEEPLAVPIAESVEEQNAPAEHELTVDVLKDGIVKVRGTEYSPEGFRAFLNQVVATTPRDDEDFSTLRVIIRGDSRTSFAHVQRIIQDCGARNIWEVELGAKPD
jgi:biopolymer transport protein ExbD